MSFFQFPHELFFLFLFKRKKKVRLQTRRILLTRPRTRQDVWSKNGKIFLQCVRWGGRSERKREERTEAVG